LTANVSAWSPTFLFSGGNAPTQKILGILGISRPY
jgi:hypothetical protein